MRSEVAVAERPWTSWKLEDVSDERSCSTRFGSEYLQQTAEQLHAIAHCTGKQYHDTNTRKAGVAPERVRHQCFAIVLDLVVHPPNKHRDRCCTDDQQRDIGCAADAMDIG